MEIASVHSVVMSQFFYGSGRLLCDFPVHKELLYDALDIVYKPVQYKA